ncbi:MAG: hypothetical protein HZB84_06705 [Deltaproteobacteria bacterium]|nr:hypothetical protein [Deltaproteobacteria bacterium]
MKVTDLTRPGEQELLELERTYCSFGDTVHYIELPKIFERCEGSWLFDLEDRPYLDMQMWYSAVNFGYRNADIEEAHNRQMARLPQLACQYLHREKIMLAAIAPRFWLPTISSDKDGVVAGAYTAGQDALAYHSYTLDVDYGAASSRFYYNAAYAYDYFYPTFTIEAHKKPVLYSNFLNRGDYYEENRSYSFKVSVPLNRMESKYSFILGYMWQRRSALSGLDGGGDFNGAGVFQGRRGNVFAGMDFSNTVRYPYSISPEEGRTASLLYRLYSKAIGSDVGSQEYVLSYSEYLRPYSEGYRHDVICLKLKGGISAGERIGRQAFQLGGDARVDLTLGYRLKVTPALGVAHGFNQDGETRVYFLIYSSL